MKKIIFTTLFIVLIFLVTHSFAGPSSIRCGSTLIDVGDTKQKVRKYCKKPSKINRVKRQKGGSNSWGAVRASKGEIWTYDWGANQFIQKLTFVGDKLTSIEQVGYGGK